MKDKAMFLLPLIILVFLTIFLGYRWWSERTMMPELKSLIESGGIEIEDRVPTEKLGVRDGESMTLLPILESVQGEGVVRFSQDHKEFTVTAVLPKPRGIYQAWIINSKGIVQNLGVLKEEKVGYTLDVLVKRPLAGTYQVVVSLEEKKAETPGAKILEGSITL